MIGIFRTWSELDKKHSNLSNIHLNEYGTDSLHRIISQLLTF